MLYLMSLLRFNDFNFDFLTIDHIFDDYSGDFRSGKYMHIVKSGKKYYIIDPLLKSWKIYQNTALPKYGFYTLQ